ncbi:MAG: hypothetical protein GEU79_04500 [Acidimicrobiia bacterium]|nr:hypothetical protein [Acidimicrobiia bacterium]
MRNVIWRSTGVVIAAALTAAALYLPATEPMRPGTEALISLETDVTCPLTEPVGDRNNTLNVAASEPGTVGLVVFAAGEELGNDVLEMGQPGVAQVDLSEIAQVGDAPTLISFPTGLGRGESMIVGETAISASGCVVPTNSAVSVGGASTDNGEDVILVLSNPYAVDSRLNVTVISENGTEANRDLESFVVPPRTTSTINLSGLFPGRLRIGAIITPEVGSVVAGLRWTGSRDFGESAASPLAEDQYFVIPATQRPGGTRLMLQTAESVDVPVRVDVMSNNGEVTTSEEIIPARSSIVVGLGPRETSMTVRVRAGAPIGADVRMFGGGAHALLPGTTASAGTWFVPGAGVGPQGSRGKVTIHAPGDRAATVDIGPIGGESVHQVEVPARGTRAARLPQGLRNDVAVTSNVPVIVTFSTERDSGLAADTALPIIEGGD